MIYISYTYAIPIGLPLEKEIRRRGHEVRWFADQKNTRSAITYDQFHTIKEVIDYHPDFVLTATDIVPDFISGVKVQIFHGFFAQKRPEHHSFAHFRIRGFFDLYCTQGPSTTVVFKKLAKKYGYFDVIETGWSKVDPLFPIEKKEIAPIPTIMIASTFTQRLSLAYNDVVFQEIKKLSQEGKFNFLMVLHPKLPVHIKEKWNALNGEFFQYVNTTDMIPLMQQSAVLFSDTTSAIQEFSLQQKPTVVFNHTFPHDYLIHVHEAKKIKAALDYALTYPEELLEKLKAFTQNLHPYTDGKSSARVIDSCIAFGQKDKSHLKSKRLNLIRKFKIRKKLHYYTLKTYRRAPTFNKK